MGISLENIKKQIEERYNKKHATKITRVLSSIVNDRNKKVRFTEGLDYICSECPLHQSVCKSTPALLTDKWHLIEYDFKNGEQYSTKEILERLKKIDGSFMFDIFG